MKNCQNSQFMDFFDWSKNGAKSENQSESRGAIFSKYFLYFFPLFFLCSDWLIGILEKK